MAVITKKLIILGILFLYYRAPAQPLFNPLDSLHVLLESAKTDADRIDTYLALSRTHMLVTNNMQEGLNMAEKVLDLATQIGSKRFQADAICFIGMTKRGLLKAYSHHFKEAYDIAIASGDPNSILFAAYLHTQYFIKQPDDGIAFLKPLIDRYKSVAWNKHVGNSYKVLAWQYEQNGDFLEAERANLAAIDYFIEVGKNPPIDKDLGRPSSLLMDQGKGNLRQTYIYLAELYSKMGRYGDAERTALMAYNSALEGDSEADLFWTIMRLGGIYKDFGKYKEAIELYTDALTKIRAIYSPQSGAEIYLALGEVYSDVGELEEAEKRYLLAYDIGMEASSHAGDILISLAEVKYKQEDYKSASNYYLRADTLFQSMNDDSGRIQSQLGLAKTQITNGLNETAIQSLERVLSLAKEMNNERVIFDIYMTMSDAQLGNGNINKSLQSADSAHKIAITRAEELELLRSSHKQLSELYEKQGEYKQSLYHRKEHQAIKDSLFSEMTVQKLKEEQVSQNVIEYIEEKESAQQLANALKSQNTLYIVLSTLLGILLLGGSYLIYQLRKSRRKVEEQNIELNELNATKDRFFGIIAHDIRSPIAALQSVDGQMKYFAQKGETSKLIQLSSMVGGTATRLNDLLDNLLNWAMLQTKSRSYQPEPVNLSTVVEEAKELFLTNAIDKQVNISTKIDESLTVITDRTAIQTVIRNLMSNAIKFSQEQSEVLIEAEDDHGSILMKISDNGVGMNASQLESIYQVGKKSRSGTKGETGTGLGLVLVKELVEYNKGQVYIESAINQGTTVTIRMPKS